MFFIGGVFTKSCLILDYLVIFETGVEILTKSDNGWFLRPPLGECALTLCEIRILNKDEVM